MLGGDKPKIGAPLVKGASVQCDREHGQATRSSLSRKAPQDTHRKRGHRQHSPR
jgi:ribosomal protein L21